MTLGPRGEDYLLPARIERIEPRPIVKRIGITQSDDRVGCMPGAWDAAKPHIVFPRSVQPYD